MNPQSDKNAEHLREDMGRLAVVTQKVAERLVKLEENEDEAFLDAIAFQLQAFYTGMESFLEKALAAQGIRIAKGQDSHAQILLAARQAHLIPERKFDYVKDLTKFRHYARHGYGFNLEKAILVPKAKQLPEFWEQFQKLAEHLIKKLEAKTSGGGVK
jgi:hypothetical protein